jgi:hypothetical protein
MNNIYRLCILALVATFSVNSFAALTKLVSATNEEDTNSMVISLITDSSSDVTGINVKLISKSGSVKIDKNHNTEDVYSGFTLMEKEGRKIVRLESNNFSGHQGGAVIIDYLYNGITGSRAALILDLSRDGDKWNLTYKGSKTRKLHFVSHKKMLIGTIGVKRVIVQ